MAYDVYYQPNGPLVGDVANAAGHGLMLEDRQQQLEAIDRFNRQQAQEALLQQQRLGYADLADQRRVGLDYASLANRQQLAAQGFQNQMALQALNQQGQ